MPYDKKLWLYVWLAWHPRKLWLEKVRGSGHQPIAEYVSIFLTDVWYNKAYTATCDPFHPWEELKPWRAPIILPPQPYHASNINLSDQIHPYLKCDLWILFFSIVQGTTKSWIKSGHSSKIRTMCSRWGDGKMMAPDCRSGQSVKLTFLSKLSLIIAMVGHWGSG